MKRHKRNIGERISFSEKEFEVPAKYNAKIFPAGKGSIIVFNDWSDSYSKAFLFSEEGNTGKGKFLEFILI